MSEPEFKQSDYLFRHHYGKVVALLVHRYGFHNSESVEDAVSEAIYRALKTWPIRGRPENPGAWLHTTAQRVFIDHLRRKQNYESKILRLASFDLADNSDHDHGTMIEDEFLRMVFMCCHPSLKESDQIAITLKLVSGLSISEISKALNLNKETIKKRIQRARKKLADSSDFTVLNNTTECSNRASRVRTVLYLLFNEGYHSLSHEDGIRVDLCVEAMRLCKLLIKAELNCSDISHALLAMMCFHAARLPARLGAEDALVLLEHQDRSLWDQRLIRIARHHMEIAMQSEKLTQYHLEATIAALHSSTPRFSATPWTTLVELYQQLIRVKKSPLASLNLCMTHVLAGQYAEAERAFESVRSSSLGAYQHLIPAVRAQIEFSKGEFERARASLWEAIDTAPNVRERALLVQRYAAWEG